MISLYQAFAQKHFEVPSQDCLVNAFHFQEPRRGVGPSEDFEHDTADQVHAKHEGAALSLRDRGREA